MSTLLNPPQTPSQSAAPARAATSAGATEAASTVLATDVLERASRSDSEALPDTMEMRPLTEGYDDKMENAGFEREDLASRGRVSTVELSEVSASTPSPTPAPTLLSINGTGGGATSCSEHCQALHLQHQRQYAPLTDKEAEATAVATAGGATGRQLPESPWHHLKTVFLVGTLIFLALWILVYTLLSQLAVL